MVSGAWNGDHTHTLPHIVIFIMFLITSKITVIITIIITIITLIFIDIICKDVLPLFVCGAAFHCLLTVVLPFAPCVICFKKCCFVFFVFSSLLGKQLKELRFKSKFRMARCVRQINPTSLALPPPTPLLPPSPLPPPRLTLLTWERGLSSQTCPDLSGEHGW